MNLADRIGFQLKCSTREYLNKCGLTDNSVIGEPTGTSSKFANMMGQAVKKFFDDKGVDDIRLTLIPLEGEGTIEHRVDR